MTVVGYPEQPVPPAAAAVPGMAGVRMAISSVRAIAVIALVLALLVAAGAVVGVVSLRGQIDELSTQVADVTAQQAEFTALIERARQAQPAPAPQSSGESEQSSVAQLPAAPTLPEAVTLPRGVEIDGALAIGDPNASNVVEVYVDYQCPYCQRWEQEIGTVLTQRAQQPGSDLLIKQYNLAFLGETNPNLDPPGPSARAASAAACVLEGEGSEGFASFNAEVFALADPNESASQFATDALTGVAAELGASDETLVCIEDVRHLAFVAALTQSGFGRGVQGTPTVIVNGRTLENTFADEELITLAAG